MVGISYYAVALVGHILEGAESVAHFDARLVVGLLTPLVIVLTWTALRRARRKLGVAEA